METGSLSGGAGSGSFTEQRRGSGSLNERGWVDLLGGGAGVVFGQPLESNSRWLSTHCI